MIKKHNWILTIFLITFLIACVSTPEVRFKEPQPINKHDLKSFPKKYQGKFRSTSDSSILTIDSKMITEELISVARISKLDMQEELDTIFSSDTEVQLGDNLTLIIKIDGDSATMRTYGGIDTLFTISEDLKLRTFKGYLFLNFKCTDSTWRVKTLGLIDGKLDFEELISHNQIDSLKDITFINIEIDTASNRIEHYDLNPRKKELKEILKVRQTETGYIKIK